MSKEKEVKKNPEEETGKKTAKELQQEVAEKMNDLDFIYDLIDTRSAEERFFEPQGES